MITSLLLILACGEKETDTSVTAEPATEPSSEASAEPSGEPATEPATETDEQTPAEAFCELYGDTCGEWDGAASCVDWYNAADAGTEGDTSGASQACYDYHLGAAAGDTDADPANGVYSMHCDHAAGAAPCVDEEPPTAAEAFCELWGNTCGTWEGAASCVDWYNAADAGTEGDTSGASQACYEYHLGAAAGDTDADPANGMYSMHCDHAAGAAPCE